MISLTCDLCHGGAKTLVELREVGRSSDRLSIVPSEYVAAQVHWECLPTFLKQRDAALKEAEEPPF